MGFLHAALPRPHRTVQRANDRRLFDLAATRHSRKLGHRFRLLDARDGYLPAGAEAHAQPAQMVKTTMRYVCRRRPATMRYFPWRGERARGLCLRPELRVSMVVRRSSFVGAGSTFYAEASKKKGQCMEWLDEFVLMLLLMPVARSSTLTTIVSDPPPPPR